MFIHYLNLCMPEIKVQKISRSLFVCLPKVLLDGDLNLGHVPLNIDVGDTIRATRTPTGILYEPIKDEGSVWRLMSK